MIVCGQLLERALRASGIDAIYGRPLPGVRVTEVKDEAIALLLATAHEQVNHRSALVHLGDGMLVRADHLENEVVVIESVEDIVGLPMMNEVHGRSLKLSLDPESLVADVMPLPSNLSSRWELPEQHEIRTIRDSLRPIVLAGPGVVTHQAQASLHAFAVGASVGVLNTWGAKGVFDWRSRHHLATVGLQARDFELGGLADADLIVATGIDFDEAPGDKWQIAPVVTLDPTSLGPLAESLHRPHQPLEPPPLRARLAAVTQQGWSRSSGPLAPSRVTLHYSQCLTGGGLVTADAGLPGFWVARTFSTTELGATSVPARPNAGTAIASVIVARRSRPWRPALAVTDGPIDDELETLLEVAASLGVGVGVEVWDPGGPALSADDHLDRLRGLAVTSGQEVVRLRTDPGQLDHMLEAAGPIIAWQGLSNPSEA
jgi:hypothetical protein